jgi:hypothetical protein
VSLPGEAVQFLETSSKPTVYWSWNFGDGTTSWEQHPIHTYSQAGVYEVTLTATYCDGVTDSHTMNHLVGNAGIEESPAGHLLTISPNPFSQSFVIASGVPIGDVELRIVDMSGREVFRQLAGQVQPEGLTIDPAGLSSGQYVLEIAYSFQGAGALERHKLQVQR